MNNYPEIETIDLAKINSTEQFHYELKSKLNFPEYYGNNFDAFWDMITSGYMVSNLIFYNAGEFSTKLNEEAGRLARLRIDFNKQSSFEIIQYDRITSKTTLSNLFGDEPLTYGLRGDPGLWKELEKKYLNYKWTTENQIFEELKGEIEKILESSIEEPKMIFVKRFSKGGMSSGKVSTGFWLRVGIPLIIGRYKKLKKAENNV